MQLWEEPIQLNHILSRARPSQLVTCQFRQSQITEAPVSGRAAFCVQTEKAKYLLYKKFAAIPWHRFLGGVP